jgi:hypothetical protein
VNAAFLNALGDGTIGERLGKPVDREQQLAGNTWFYYGSRYGEWLGSSHSGDPEDFVPAQLEQSPASASGYIAVAEYYAEAGKIDRAVDAQVLPRSLRAEPWGWCVTSARCTIRRNSPGSLAACMA